MPQQHQSEGERGSSHTDQVTKHGKNGHSFGSNMNMHKIDYAANLALFE